MNLLRALIPPFLRRLDLDLLQSWPRLWSTRIHLHLWFLLLVNAVVFLLSWLVPVNTWKFPDPEELWGYMVVPGTVYFALWVYRVVLFTPEKRFGKRIVYAEVGEMAMHLVSILLIWSIPYTFSLTVAYRIGTQVSDRTFVEHVDLLNRHAYLFINDRGFDWDEATALGLEDELADLDHAYHGYYEDTHGYFRDLNEYVHRNDTGVRELRPLQALYEEYLEAADAVDDPYSNNYDPAQVKYYRNRADSIARHYPYYFVRHGLYTPYAFRTDHHASPFVDSWRLEQEYIAMAGSTAPPDAVRINEVLAIGRTYFRFVNDISAEVVVRQFQNKERTSARLIPAQTNISRIWDAKNRNYFFCREEGMFHALFISAFVLSILLSAFKNSYWQPFLIAVVTACVLPIVIVLFALITEHSVFTMGDGDIMMYTYFWLAWTVVVATPFFLKLPTYSTTAAVVTMLSNVVVPFLALATIALLREEFDVFGEDALRFEINRIRDLDPQHHSLEILNERYLSLRDRIELIMYATLWGGMALYLFAIHPFYRSLYMRFIALPERK